MWQCKHCGKEFDNLSLSQKANHSRWCDDNPKKEEYKKSRAGIDAMNAARELNPLLANQFTKAKALGIEIPDGPNKGKKNLHWKPHTEKTKEVIREKALVSNHRRLRRKLIEYKGVLLDSSWELAMARRLDELGVKWIRPAPLKWTDEYGTEHHYFPDFYLPEYDLYLDPKNQHAYDVQKSKIIQLISQIKNLKIITSLKDINEFRVD